MEKYFVVWSNGVDCKTVMKKFSNDAEARRFAGITNTDAFKGRFGKWVVRISRDGNNVYPFPSEDK